MTKTINRLQVRMLTVVGVAATVLFAGCDAQTAAQTGAGAAPPPPTVVVEPAKIEDLASSRTYTGRVEAIDTVAIRARVSGFLKSRNFQEGGEVKEGDLLFEIEREPFEIAVSQAEANLASSKAALTLAQQTYDRNEQLARRNVTSQANLDDARAKLDEAQAVIKAREADVRKAKLDLSYTQITAPFTGLISRAGSSMGAYLTAPSDPLATVVKQDPMYVTFPVPQRLLLEVRREGRGPESVYVQLILSDGTAYEQKGAIEFADVQATSSTDSVLIRATMPNPDRLLVDRQIVDVRVIRKEPERKLVINQSALMLDQQGAYVLTVGDDNKATMQRIQTGDQRGSLIVVESGLKESQRVIVSGQQKVQPGAQVSPQLAAPNSGADGSAAATSTPATTTAESAPPESSTSESATATPAKSDAAGEGVGGATAPAPAAKDKNDSANGSGGK